MRKRTTGYNKLTDKACRNAKSLLGDGGNLWLHVDQKTAAKRWSFRFMLRGVAHEMGLGPYPLLGLAEARQLRDDARRLLLQGVNPIEERRRQQLAAVQHPLAQVLEEFIADKGRTWKRPAQAQRWRTTLRTHAPKLLEREVQTITAEDVLLVLRPVWTAKPSVGAYLRSNLENLIDYATARGWRAGENPARWRGHLDHLLTKQKGGRRHHAALPWQDIAAFWERLAAVRGSAAACLRFTILTACRPAEARGARWGEIDLTAKVWTIPAERMKAGREHRIPLSDEAVAVLRGALPKQHPPAGALVFASLQRGKPLSDVGVSDTLRRLGYGREAVTVHGFRSTFRDWAAEATGFPHEVAEMALAHVVANATEAAYRRGDLFDKRCKLMAAWASYITAQAGRVIALAR